MSKLISLDVETTLDVCQKLRVITICKSGGEPEIVYRYDIHGEVVPESVVQLLADSACIIHNAFFDCGVLTAHGIKLGSIWCTFLAEMFISDQAPMVSLKDLVDKYQGVKMDKDQQKTDWSQSLTEDQILYCYEDVRYLEEVWREQYAYLRVTNQLPHVQMMNEIINVWAGDLYYGVPVDEKKLADIYNQCLEEYRGVVQKLVETVNPKCFVGSTLTGKMLLEELQPYSAEQLPIKKMELLALLESGGLDDPIRELVKNRPFSPLLIDSSSPSFAKKLAGSLGLEKDASWTKDSVADFTLRNPEHEFTRCMELVMKAREVMKVASTYAQLPEGRHYVDTDGLTRIKFKNSFTVSGRIGLVPWAVMPKSEDEDDPKSKLRDCYIPPKGYTILSADFSALEDCVSGILYNDATKLKAVYDGFDLHLMFAAKLFGTFTYDDPKQTAELKKKYKAFRQAVKGINFARGYGAGGAKLEMLMKKTFTEQGIDCDISGEELIQAWSDTFPGIAEAQEFINEKTAGLVQEAYNKFNYDRNTRKLMTEWSRDDAHPANIERKRVLADSRQVIHAGSVLGLRRLFPTHKYFSGVPLGGKKARVTDVVNFIIQTSATSAMWLSLLMIKKLFPSIIIAAEIHDSLIMYVPEQGLPGITLEEIKESVDKLMGVSGYLLFGKFLKVDSHYCDKGW